MLFLILAFHSFISGFSQKTPQFCSVLYFTKIGLYVNSLFWQLLFTAKSAVYIITAEDQSEFHCYAKAHA